MTCSVGSWSGFSTCILVEECEVHSLGPQNHDLRIYTHSCCTTGVAKRQSPMFYSHRVVYGRERTEEKSQRQSLPPKGKCPKQKNEKKGSQMWCSCGTLSRLTPLLCVTPWAHAIFWYQSNSLTDASPFCQTKNPVSLIGIT